MNWYKTSSWGESAIEQWDMIKTKEEIRDNIEFIKQSPIQAFIGCPNELKEKPAIINAFIEASKNLMTKTDIRSCARYIANLDRVLLSASFSMKIHKEIMKMLFNIIKEYPKIYYEIRNIKNISTSLRNNIEMIAKYLKLPMVRPTER